MGWIWEKPSAEELEKRISYDIDNLRTKQRNRLEGRVESHLHLLMSIKGAAGFVRSDRGFR